MIETKPHTPITYEGTCKMCSTHFGNVKPSEKWHSDSRFNRNNLDVFFNCRRNSYFTLTQNGRTKYVRPLKGA